MLLVLILFIKFWPPYIVARMLAGFYLAPKPLVLVWLKIYCCLTVGNISWIRESFVDCSIMPDVFISSMLRGLFVFMLPPYLRIRSAIKKVWFPFWAASMPLIFVYVGLWLWAALNPLVSASGFMEFLSLLALKLDIMSAKRACAVDSVLFFCILFIYSRYFLVAGFNLAPNPSCVYPGRFSLLLTFETLKPLPMVECMITLPGVCIFWRPLS